MCLLCSRRVLHVVAKRDSQSNDDEQKGAEWNERAHHRVDAKPASSRGCTRRWLSGNTSRLVATLRPTCRREPAHPPRVRTRRSGLWSYRSRCSSRRHLQDVAPQTHPEVDMASIRSPLGSKIALSRPSPPASVRRTGRPDARQLQRVVRATEGQRFTLVVQRRPG
jgi:hypothetical protein